MLVAFLIGLTFGIGLVISGMSNPAVVLGFLDFTGHWNPALAFVMGGALVTAFPAYAYARRVGKTLQGAPITLPVRFGITRALVLGSALFGVGWGLSGFCPGPAIVAAATLNPVVLIFLASMAAGTWVRRRLQPAAPAGTAPSQSDAELSCS